MVTIIFSVDPLIEKMKEEINADIAAGVVPATVSEFSQLHDYVDANCYGGLCDDDYMTKVWESFGCSPDDGCPEEAYNVINAAQSAVNSWLEAGRG